MADVAAIAASCWRHDAAFVVDGAHAIGAIGARAAVVYADRERTGQVAQPNLGGPPASGGRGKARQVVIAGGGWLYVVCHSPSIALRQTPPWRPTGFAKVRTDPSNRRGSRARALFGRSMRAHDMEQRREAKCREAASMSGAVFASEAGPICR